MCTFLEYYSRELEAGDYITLGQVTLCKTCDSVVQESYAVLRA